MLAALHSLKKALIVILDTTDCWVVFATCCWQTCAAFVQVLLLDEVTVDMDVVARLDLLQFFRYGSRPPFVVLWLITGLLFN